MVDRSISAASLVGQRILARVGGTYALMSPVEEVKVREVSPSGTWIKLLNTYGKQFWRPVGDVAVVEILKDLTADRPREEAS